ncbi:hypothetical protein V6N13_131306 [Hibiscus sabdariffa]|uniref:Uncharacterized protein n=1 Tax=Hibiscus sabdariffa TaxID=183260 RepID=A0ABR2D7G5_9ROSI
MVLVWLLNVRVLLHAEAGKGQFELALEHSACTYAAHNLISTREAVRAGKGLLKYSMSNLQLLLFGIPCASQCMAEWEKNVFTASGASSRHRMSKIGEKFMAGVLAHLHS